MPSARFRPRLARALSGLGLALLLAVLAGCSPGTGNVSGKVTYKGQPLPGAIVTFQPADPGKNAMTVALDKESRYSVTLPAGEVRLTVDTRVNVPKASMPMVPPNLEKEAQAKDGEKDAPKGEDGGRRSGKFVPIPERYASVELSGLKFTVKAGDQTQDIDLTD
ncbi:MAG TPA: carboxypeptidase-like regulatory domain-containing protein [Gemmataceae bacterium]|nr:carboxypeptidase-like regulatory domain-containing protein [Gemmataceae bacterium]